MVNSKQLCTLIDQMIADAMEWETVGAPDGYWKGVAYMIASVAEHANEEDNE